MIGREVGGGLGNREGERGDTRVLCYVCDTRMTMPMCRIARVWDVDCVSPVSGITTRRVGASFGGMLRCGQKSAKQGG